MAKSLSKSQPSRENLVTLSPRTACADPSHQQRARCWPGLGWRPRPRDQAAQRHDLAGFRCMLSIVIGAWSTTAGQMEMGWRLFVSHDITLRLLASLACEVFRHSAKLAKLAKLDTMAVGYLDVHLVPCQSQVLSTTQLIPVNNQQLHHRHTDIFLSKQAVFNIIMVSLKSCLALVAASLSLSSAQYTGSCSASDCGASHKVCPRGYLCVPYPSFEPSLRQGCTCSYA